MMELHSRAGGVSAASVGGASTAVHELIRSEVSGRGVVSERLMLQRVEIACKAGAEEVKQVFEALEKMEEIRTGKMKKLYATPLRLVRLDQGLYRVITSLPTHELTRLLTASTKGHRNPYELTHNEDLSRELMVNHDDPGRLKADEGRLASIVKSVGGAIVTPESWARFELTPIADDTWIKMLDSRLEWESEVPLNTYNQQVLDWKTPEVKDGSYSYVSEYDSATRLWRTKFPTTEGYDKEIFVWTAAGAHPKESPTVRLSRDEAIRTIFALARSLEEPIQATYERSGMRLADGVFLKTPFIPIEEYRYLRVISRQTEGAKHLIPYQVMDQVKRRLFERLGLMIVDS